LISSSGVAESADDASVLLVSIPTQGSESVPRGMVQLALR
jgi:hypothetical protein